MYIMITKCVPRGFGLAGATHFADLPGNSAHGVWQGLECFSVVDLGHFIQLIRCKYLLFPNLLGGYMIVICIECYIIYTYIHFCYNIYII